MRIGEAAAAVGVTIKTVRFYAEQGLLGSVPRAGAYRDFDAKLADLAEESKRLETQIRRLVETRRYLAGRAAIEAER